MFCFNHINYVLLQFTLNLTLPAIAQFYINLPNLGVIFSYTLIFLFLILFLNIFSYFSIIGFLITVYFYPLAYDFDIGLVNTLLINPIDFIHPPILYIVIIYNLLIYLQMLLNKPTTWFFQTLFFNLSFLAVRLSITTLLLGSWWAMQESSWGGWWVWERSENFLLLLTILYLKNIHTRVDFFNLLNFVGLYLKDCIIIVVYSNFLNLYFSSTLHAFFTENNLLFIVFRFYCQLLFLYLILIVRYTYIFNFKSLKLLTFLVIFLFFILFNLYDVTVNQYNLVLFLFIYYLLLYKFNYFIFFPIHFILFIIFMLNFFICFNDYIFFNFRSSTIYAIYSIKLFFLSKTSIDFVLYYKLLIMKFLFYLNNRIFNPISLFFLTFTYLYIYKIFSFFITSFVDLFFLSIFIIIIN